MENLTLVFDLDGTLVDTAPDLINAANYVLSLKDFAPADEQLLRPKISFGARAIIEEALACQGATLPAQDIDHLFDRFIDHYSANIAKDSLPYPGLTDVLAQLQQQGARLAVCTNKRENLSLDLLEQLGLTPYFQFIAGRDTFPIHKPDPRHLLLTIEAAGGTRSRAIMVGDSQTDISTAQAAKIPVIGVTFGYSTPPMAALRPDVTIDSYDDFSGAVADLLLLHNQNAT